jgi:alpha-tubulin suppressor-like RCC1 family protein
MRRVTAVFTSLVLLGVAVACAPPAPPPPPADPAPVVVAGGDHTCAVLADETVTCWGLNNRGQLGNATNNGTNTANPTPTVVVGLP